MYLLRLAGNVERSKVALISGNTHRNLWATDVKEAQTIPSTPAHARLTTGR